MLSPFNLYAGGLTNPRLPVRVRLSDGSEMRLALERFLAPADATDQWLLEDVGGPVLDVGCGPGRHLHALAKRGVFGLGVDLSPVAVELARDRGTVAIVGSIFDDVPGAGTWRTALLLDGNIGIGGAPDRLLTRVGGLLAPAGEVLVELESPHTATAILTARLETAAETSAWFQWARVSCPDIESVADRAEFELAGSSQRGDRWFARLRKR